MIQVGGHECRLSFTLSSAELNLSGAASDLIHTGHPG